MSGFQFIHVESYARTSAKSKTGAHSLASIVAEAERDPGACPHIETPKPPRQLYGCTPRKAAAQAAEWGEQAKDVKGRKLRTDGLCMLAGVISMPRDRAADWPQFRDATVQYLLRKYGDRLRSVVEHTDEENPHMHFYAVPLPCERFETLHAGRAAVAQIKAEGKLKGEQNKAYKAAMRGLQDEFYEQVAKFHGLARFGPKRQRLSRAEWVAQQKASGMIADALRLLSDGVTPVEPLPRSQSVKMDWEVARKAAGESTRRLFGKESYTPEQLQQAMEAAARQAILITREDEERRFEPVLNRANKLDFSTKIAVAHYNAVADKMLELKQKNERLSELEELFTPQQIALARAEKQKREELERQAKEELRERERLLALERSNQLAESVPKQHPKATKAKQNKLDDNTPDGP